LDPLTHALLGGATSYALFGHKLGVRAAVVGALAGMAPDADHFVSSKKDVLLYVEFHRAFTHSIFFAVIGSLISVLPWILRKRFKPQWKLFWLCAFPAYLTHCFLDTSTTYGTQILWPFTRNRYAWDLIAVIDLLFTGALALGLIMGVVKKRRFYTVASLVFCGIYLTAGGIQKMRAMNAQEKIATARGHTIERTEVMPTLANLAVWRSLYLSGGQLYSDRIRVGITAPTMFREGSSLPLMTTKLLTDVEAKGNRVTHAFDRFAWFSGHWVARSPFDETVLGDMRYSISTKAFDPIWGIRFISDDKEIRVEWINRQLKRKINLGELWLEIVGKHPEYGPISTGASAR
jgi:inner membrane protein